jgi:prepilin-type N-terminal cleavage/methylation domain-containing protein
MIRARVRTGRRLKNRRGFSMPELMAAVMILAVGVLGLASTAAVMTRQVNGGAKQSTAAQVAESRLEMMRATPCGALSAGSASTRGVDEAWTVAPGANNTVRARVTVIYTANRVPQTRTYVSGIAC